MQYYFIHTAAGQEGPFTLQELKSKNITKETLIWHEGLPEWIKAGEVMELKIIFVNAPPLKEIPIPTPPPPPLPPLKENQTTDAPVKKDDAVSQTAFSKNKYKSVLIPAVIILLLALAAFFYFKNSSKNKDKEKLIGGITDSSSGNKNDTLSTKDSVNTDTLKLINLDTLSSMINWDTASRTKSETKEVVETNSGGTPSYFIDTKKSKEKKKKTEKNKTTTAQEKERPGESREEEKPTVVKEIDASDFLTVRGFFKKNLLLEAVLEGTISNRNSNTSFRDVIVEVKFVDAEAGVIEVKSFTQNGVVQGGQDISFKFKTRAPKGSKSARFRIVNAKINN